MARWIEWYLKEWTKLQSNVDHGTKSKSLARRRGQEHRNNKGKTIKGKREWSIEVWIARGEFCWWFTDGTDAQKETSMREIAVRGLPLAHVLRGDGHLGIDGCFLCARTKRWEREQKSINENNKTDWREYCVQSKRIVHCLTSYLWRWPIGISPRQNSYDHLNWCGLITWRASSHNYRGSVNLPH